jgi:hypothetical protein
VKDDAALQSGDSVRAEILPDYADGWRGLIAEFQRLGDWLVSVRGRAGITALLDSMPLAVSFAEVRREPDEDLDAEPLEIEPLEGDEGF